MPPTKAGWRQFLNTEGQVLHPEQATNWGIGGEFAPITFLRGLDLQATWYSVKITGVLRAFGNPTTSAFNDASRGFSYIIPTDLFSVNPACNNNLTPTTCPEFENMVLAMLSNPRNPVPSAALTNITWLNDGGTFNKGWQKTTGIDWTASYDFDSGDFGAWNVGMTGTYYLHWYSQTTDDGEVTGPVPLHDQFSERRSAGRRNVGRRYRRISDALSRARRLEQRSVEFDRLHGLRVALFPYAKRAAASQLRMHDSRRLDTRRHIGLRDQQLLQHPAGDVHLRSFRGL